MINRLSLPQWQPPATRAGAALASPFRLTPFASERTLNDSETVPKSTSRNSEARSGRVSEFRNGRKRRSEWLGMNSEWLGNDSEWLGDESESLGNSSERLGNSSERLGNNSERLGT